jgi:hypothetical protein
VTERWRDAFDKLRAADTEQKAALATADLVAEVIEGGVAVGEAAEAAATWIIGNVGIRGDFRVYFLWVLFEMGRCVGLWAKGQRVNRLQYVHPGVEREARVASVLATGQGAYVDLMSDREPEVRSMASLLLGLCARDPAAAAQLLAEHERTETQRLAKACVRQATLVALARAAAEDRQPALIELIREYVRSGTSEDRGRLRRVVEEHSGPDLSSAAREVLGDTVARLTDPEGPFWQIEEL